VSEAIVEVWEKLERIENSPILWPSFIVEKLDLMTKQQYINSVKQVCEDIKHLLARTAIPHMEEVVWTVMDVSEILTIVQLPLKYDPGRIRRVAQVRGLLQQEIKNQKYVEAMNKYYSDNAKELQEKYGVTPHLITDDPATHTSDFELEEIQVQHRWWHLRREKNCRRCNPRAKDEEMDVVARFDEKGQE
jgi:virulence-associated protein VapD